MIAETTTTLSTPDGASLEAKVAAPAGALGGVVACHPHPLYGGDMDNPVVVRAVEVCADQGLATLRFNFRGVGTSTGRHGNGVAERADVQAALDHLAHHLPSPSPLALLGYSFGAAVAAHVAGDRPALSALCLIAPPLSRTDMCLPRALASFTRLLAIVAGTRDEYCPVAALEALATSLPGARISRVDGANHFFFGKLFPLGEHVAAWARTLVHAS